MAPALPLRRQPIFRRLAARPRPEKRKEPTCAALPPSLPGPRFILSLPSGTGKTASLSAPSPGSSRCPAVALPAPLLRWRRSPLSRRQRPRGHQEHGDERTVRLPSPARRPAAGPSAGGTPGPHPSRLRHGGPGRHHGTSLPPRSQRATHDTGRSGGLSGRGPAGGPAGGTACPACRRDARRHGRLDRLCGRGLPLSGAPLPGRTRPPCGPSP